VWEGVIAGVLYARKPLSSPPRIVRASSVAGLMQAIEADETVHGERTARLPLTLAVLAGRHPGWRISPALPGSLSPGFIAVEAVTGRRITAATTLAGMDAALNGEAQP
jgi:hypothetical protein